VNLLAERVGNVNDGGAKGTGGNLTEGMCRNKGRKAKMNNRNRNKSEGGKRKKKKAA
jgi:hypothetical protein